MFPFAEGYVPTSCARMQCAVGALEHAACANRCLFTAALEHGAPSLDRQHTMSAEKCACSLGCMGASLVQSASLPVSPYST